MKKKREAERKDGPKVDGTKSNGGDDALKAKYVAHPQSLIRASDVDLQSY